MWHLVGFSYPHYKLILKQYKKTILLSNHDYKLATTDSIRNKK
jgi:hypothetical protein